MENRLKTIVKVIPSDEHSNDITQQKYLGQMVTITKRGDESCICRCADNNVLVFSSVELDTVQLKVTRLTTAEFGPYWDAEEACGLLEVPCSKRAEKIIGYNPRTVGYNKFGVYGSVMKFNKIELLNNATSGTVTRKFMSKWNDKGSLLFFHLYRKQQRFMHRLFKEDRFGEDIIIIRYEKGIGMPYKIEEVK
jgi:hypothetical protein